ncbi:MAG: indole-3-glycerol phosphate synthase TrpC [Acidobacteriota bacterium]
MSKIVQAVPDILARIVETKHAELRQLAALRPDLEIRAAQRASARPTQARDFRAALLAKQTAIISEVKKASPSKGVLQPNFDPAIIARIYANGGAAAISVLTDTQYFQGSLADLEAARAAVPVPVLRKDFTIDELHVIEAAAHGADAILLIAAILDTEQMRRLRELANEFKMAALVEVHNDHELDSAIESGADIIGVNNRNLHTFTVDLETSMALARRIPANVVKVAESGIHSREDVVTLQGAGFQAFLVGEHLMKSGDPAAALRALQA